MKVLILVVLCIIAGSAVPVDEIKFEEKTSLGKNNLIRDKRQTFGK